MRCAVVLVAVAACVEHGSTIDPAQLVAVDVTGAQLSTFVFPLTGVGQTSTVTIELRNDGADATGPIAAEVHSFFSDLAIASSSCIAPLLGGEACRLVLGFTPRVDGTRSTNLSAAASPSSRMVSAAVQRSRARAVTGSPLSSLLPEGPRLG